MEVPEGLEIKVKGKSLGKLCSVKNKNKIGIFAFPTTIENGNTICLAWGGSMFMPETIKDLKMMRDIVDQGSEVFKNYTKEVGECRNSVWVPIYKSDDATHWLDFFNRSKLVELIVKMDSDGKMLQRCALNFPIGAERYEDAKCDKEICTFCVWKNKIPFRLRGLCPVSNIEENYVLDDDPDANGFMGTNTISDF